MIPRNFDLAGDSAATRQIGIGKMANNIYHDYGHWYTDRLVDQCRHRGAYKIT